MIKEMLLSKAFWIGINTFSAVLNFTIFISGMSTIPLLSLGSAIVSSIMVAWVSTW